jgi:DNA repair protein RecN (Recombination protein N)
MLDAFGGTEQLREQFATCYQQLRDARRRLDELTESRETRMREIELYEFQADEIDAAELTPGLFEQTQGRYVKLSNLGQLKQQAQQLGHALGEADGATIEQLDTLCKHMSDLARLDKEKLTGLNEQLHDATEMLRDCWSELNRYADGLELDPEELTLCQARLDTLNRLIHKYAQTKRDTDIDIDEVDPVSAVLRYREHIAEKLRLARSQDANCRGLEAEIATLEKRLAETGQKLSAGRAGASKKLKPLVEAQLKELGMAEARFDLAIDRLDVASATPVGLERVEMIIRTNPGQDAQPLRHIASGGELSRIMLAIKTILAGRDRVGVLVFDEVDANIGGRLGSVIGRKLRCLVDSGSHQILCITHLPQIAAWADHHLHIAKVIAGEGSTRATNTTVRPLRGQARLEELAEMLAGKDFGQAALAQAREMLQASER